MKFKAVIFDLDDTLYNEFAFVKKGYETVVEYLTSTSGGDPCLLLAEMLSRYRTHGREGIFDYIIQKHYGNQVGLVPKLVQRYRTHQPTIELYEDAVAALRQLKDSGVKIGVITDGDGGVQRRKYQSLGLDRWVEQVIFTDDLGEGNSKPSTVSFYLMCAALHVDHSQACYVGDNPAKDFFGANQLKMITVRLKRGMHKDAVIKETAYDAKFAVEMLTELNDL